MYRRRLPEGLAALGITRKSMWGDTYKDKKYKKRTMEQLRMMGFTACDTWELFYTITAFVFPRLRAVREAGLLPAEETDAAYFAAREILLERSEKYENEERRILDSYTKEDEDGYRAALAAYSKKMDEGTMQLAKNILLYDSLWLGLAGNGKKERAEDFIVPQLKYFSKHLHGYPAGITYEEWLSVLDKIGEYFRDAARRKEASAYSSEEEMPEGAKLFGKYYLGLWD